MSQPPDTEAALVGLDVGSTTVKLVALLPGLPDPLAQHYSRHHGDVPAAVLAALASASPALRGRFVRAAVTGSAGLQLAVVLGLP
eukprot:m51a1_g13436 hypothetical protein (85) ;mRNA; f:1838-2240